MAEFRCRRAAGFTLIEVLITVTISTVAMVTVMGMLIYSARVSQSNLAQIHAGLASRSFYEHVARNTRQAKGLTVAADGMSVDLVLPDESVCRYYYVDGDSDPNTIMNNQVMFDPNTATSGGEASLVNGVTPVGSRVFDPSNQRSVQMNFRIGDPTNSSGHLSNLFTGPGTQGVDVNTRVSPRNMHLAGG